MSAKRKAKAKKKVSELYAKGYRLNRSEASGHYKTISRQRRMSSYGRGAGAGTGFSAEEIARGIDRNRQIKK